MTTFGLFPTVTEVDEHEDCLQVIQVGRLWRIFVNGQLLVRTKLVETPQGQKVRTVPREFLTDLQAWQFLGEKQRQYERKYGVDLGWVIKGEM